MTWEPRPTPDITPETEEYWSAATDGKLLVRECRACSLVFHYPRALCPDCFSENVDWRESTGQGTVYSYSTTQKMSGWPTAHLPLIVAYVELDEGPRMMTNIECDPGEIDIGTRVEAQFRAIEDMDAAVPVFVPLNE